MSGHSHWSGIKRKKALVDSKRAQKFTKLGRAITIASREGGENPDFNPNLRLAIEKAKEFNMPKDKILNSIKKGSSKNAEDQLEEVTYEALGPEGIMLVIETITDNRNRTVSEIRHILDEHGGKMADGGVGWNFRRRGLITFQVLEEQKEEFELKAIECSVEDLMEEEKGAVSVICSLEDIEKIKEKLSDFPIIENIVAYLSNNPVAISDKVRKKYDILLDDLENQSDVQEIWDNVEKITVI